MQAQFLPSSLPSIDGYVFAAHYESAQAIGGDYYDFVRLPGGRLGIGLGDVSGKGVRPRYSWHDSRARCGSR